MVEQIEDPIFYGPCKSINNLDTHRLTFCDATATLQSHEISKMVSQTKREIDDEVNSLLLGKGLNKMRATGEAKAVHAFKLGSPEDEKHYEYCVTFKV